MAITEQDIEELVDRIIHGAEEDFVAAITGTLLDDLMTGIENASAYNTIEYFAASNREKLDTTLMEYRSAIASSVMANVVQTLKDLDARDVELLGFDILGRHYNMIAEQTAIGIREIVERQNIALVENAAEAWYRIAGEAINAANSGVHIRGGTIERAVMKLAEAGIDTIDYRSGVSSQIDVALKRHMRTQVNQAAGRMTMERLAEADHDLVHTTSHFGARPEHAEWQGKVFCLSGTREIDGVVYPDFYTATGYGTVTGLCGANCRHHFDVYIPGISQLQTLPEDINGMDPEEYYEATQRQRELERRIRKTKRDIASLERTGIGLESPSYVQKRLVLGNQQKKLADHCKQYNLIREYPREKAYGIGGQPRALRAVTRGKGGYKKGVYKVTQNQIDKLVSDELSGIRFTTKPTYSASLGSQGGTVVGYDNDNRKYVKKILIGMQMKPDQLTLIDTLVHEELEARIWLNKHSSERYWHLNSASDEERHAYIQKIIDRYVKMKGL